MDPYGNGNGQNINNGNKIKRKPKVEQWWATQTMRLPTPIKHEKKIT